MSHNRLGSFVQRDVRPHGEGVAEYLDIRRTFFGRGSPCSGLQRTWEERLSCTLEMAGVEVLCGVNAVPSRRQSLL